MSNGSRSTGLVSSQFGPLREEAAAGDVATEDVALVNAVQRGLNSRAVEQGRLMPESKQLVAAFQRRVHDSLLEGA